MNIKNKMKELKLKSPITVIVVLFIIYLILRILMIIYTDGLHEGDAVSRTAGTHHMNFAFKIWPTEIWLPMPFWLVFIFGNIFDDWFYIPRVVAVVINCLGLIGITSVLVKEKQFKFAICFLFFTTFSAPYLFVDNLNLSEPYFTGFVGILFYGLYRLYHDDKWTSYLITSTSLAAICLTRYEGYIIMPVVALWIIYRKKNKLTNIKFLTSTSIILAAVLFMFYKNYTFGGSITWGVTGNHLSEITNYFKTFGTNEIPWMGGMFQMLPLKGYTLLSCLLGIAILLKTRNRWLQYFYLFSLVYIAFITERFANNFVTPAARYHFLSANILVFFLAQVVSKLKWKQSILLLSAYFIYQNLYFRELYSKLHGEINFESGFKEMVEYARATDINTRLHLTDRRREIDHKMWAIDSWSYLIDTELYNTLRCLTENYIIVPERTYSLVKTKKCIYDNDIEYLVLIPEGVVKEDFYSKENPLYREKWKLEYGKAGYEIYKRIRK